MLQPIPRLPGQKQGRPFIGKMGFRMEQQEPVTAKEERAYRLTGIRFYLLLAVALFLSVWHLYLQGSIVFRGAPPDTDLLGAVCVLFYPDPGPAYQASDAPPAPGVLQAAGAGSQQPAAAAYTGWHLSTRCKDAIAHARTAAQKSAEAGPHPEQTLPGAVLKIVVVCVLSLLWFFTFSYANRVRNRFIKDNPPDPAIAGTALAGKKKKHTRLRATGIKVLIPLSALIPALVFSMAMYSAYEPAVFVMALVAIYVAAEHYDGLIDTEHELKHRTDDLKKTLGTVLDADGLNIWRAEVYALYRSATWRIDGVIRKFDIDLEWWQCAGQTDPWTEYVSRCKAESDKYTLLHVMGESRAKVVFAVDLPLPHRQARAACTKVEKSKFFRDLLGLAWYLVVFDLAFKERQKRWAASDPQPGDPPGRLGLKLAYSPSWMHVVDYTVYQMIERSTAANSTVRQLTHSLGDPDDRRALSKWARDSVRTFARNGGPAEEYVFSVLRYAAFRSGYQEKDRLALADILDKLGMQEYLDVPKEEFLIATTAPPPRPGKNNLVILGRADAENLCEAVFRQLILLRLQPPPEGVQVQDLIRELL